SFMTEYRRANVLQNNTSLKTNKKDGVNRVGGRSLCREDITLHDLISKVNNNYVFRHTNITEKFTFKQYREEKEAESVMLFFQKPDRKSTRLNSSHVSISYAVFCLKKKKT